VYDHLRAHLVGLHAVAVELHLMQPGIAGGHFLGADWAAGWMKRSAVTPQDVAASLRQSN
jgi:hypothetical protein